MVSVCRWPLYLPEAHTDSLCHILYYILSRDKQVLNKKKKRKTKKKAQLRETVSGKYVYLSSVVFISLENFISLTQRR